MKRILLVLGMIFAGLLGIILGGLGYVGVSASNSASENKATAVRLVHDVSQSWSLTRARRTFADAALAQASSRAGREALATMSRLGPLYDVRNIRQTGYRMEFGVGTTVTVAFKGLFKNGTGEVTVVLRFING
nr:hypothetical protein [Alphaproteobacteria bacterium]